MKDKSPAEVYWKIFGALLKKEIDGEIEGSSTVSKKLDKIGYI